ncbi:protein CNGC15b-like [Rhodamnia argentea]|uniref:Protein CNGC15b-like n=1 Tax=Rhodamnia argentea TaxID=178133 RepID=A0A8B8NX21_9MYRT|nr:protein CNGC15b-like [Rhodamnia argentea]
MGLRNPRSIRVHDEFELSELPTLRDDGSIRISHNNGRKQAYEPSFVENEDKKSQKNPTSLRAKVLYRVFSEDYERGKRKLLDPRGRTMQRWNRVFLAACLVSLFVDPLFFYLQVVWEEQCINIGVRLEVILTAVRSLVDIFYMIQIYIRFRTAYVAPSSRVFGRGELVIDPSKIARRYLRRGFWIDFIAALPLPQVLIWVIIPNLEGSTIANTKNVLRFIIIFQYLPRLFLIVPLTSQIVKATGVVTEQAWAGAAYNLILYLLASHVLGSCWYLLSIERQEACWKSVCSKEKSSCNYQFFDCHKVDDPARNAWFQSSNVTKLCRPSSEYYEFGIYGDAQMHILSSSPFVNKYFYCLWWGLKNLSSLGQNLSTSTYVGEIVFAIIIATLGLVLFAQLIGNMQRYLQSTTVRLEEWRVKRNDTERWMRHRQLPQELRQSIRKYDQYRWVATRGVDEESILQGLPMDLRRDIKRHLCLDLVRRVHLFDQMDDKTLDAICERLKPALCTEGTFLVREGDPVNEMLFIFRGHLDSYTTNGGRTGFFNSCHIGPGDFCGEELLTWALDLNPSIILPSSTRSVKALSEVEAFALRADDLKFVASQFRRLHSKQLRQKFRFYSHHWRTWGACFIQAAWRRFKRRKELAQLMARESSLAFSEARTQSSKSGWGVYDTEMGCSSTGSFHQHSGSSPSMVSALQKPAEPDFSVDVD